MTLMSLDIDQNSLQSGWILHLSPFPRSLSQINTDSDSLTFSHVRIVTYPNLPSFSHYLHLLYFNNKGCFVECQVNHVQLILEPVMLTVMFIFA